MAHVDVLIAAALPIELGGVVRQLSDARRLEGRSGWLGRYPASQQVAAVAVGVGATRAGEGLASAVAAHQPARILTVGVAGGLRPDLRPGTAVLITGVKTEHDEPNTPPRTSPTPLTSTLRRSATRLRVPRAEGATVTVSRVVSDPQRKQFLATSGALTVEMENRGLLEAAGECPLGMLRVVFDEAGYRLPNLGPALGPSGGLRMGALVGLFARRPALLLRLPGLMRRHGQAQRTLRQLTLEVLRDLADR